jgi:predicted RNase H-like nuclease
VVTADLPLSRAPIRERRAADDAISREFGAAGCGAHSPGPDRPGAVGRDFQAALEAAGFRLATAGDAIGAGALVEVYPHPALLRLMRTDKRVPYKVGKTGGYWPGRARVERLALVRAQLWRVAERLDTLVAGTRRAFGALVDGRWTLSGLKPAEDVLDAIVSAWVGMVALAGEAEPFGDEVAADLGARGGPGEDGSCRSRPGCAPRRGGRLREEAAGPRRGPGWAGRPPMGACAGRGGSRRS